MITPKKLQELYSYMFIGPHIGISVSKGWMPIFVELCHDIDLVLGDDKQEFLWLQVKEKFGSGRFYYGYGKKSSPIKIERINGEEFRSLTTNRHSSKPKTESDAAKREAISKLVEAAEAKTDKSCMCCGSPGEKLDTGWVITLCDKHKRIHQGNQQHGLSGLLWFNEEDQFS